MKITNRSIAVIAVLLFLVGTISTASPAEARCARYGMGWRMHHNPNLRWDRRYQYLHELRLQNRPLSNFIKEYHWAYPV